MSDSSTIRAADLFDRFNRTVQGASARTGRIVFKGVDGFDVYNITAPFRSSGRTVIAGRVEKRDSEKSHVGFFEARDGAWHLIPDAPRFQLQDPFFTFIGQELVFGGVETFEVDHCLQWRTAFFRGLDIFSLTPFFQGPMGMKDIRLTQLQDGRIGIFTRPQGVVGGRGTIGYTEADSLDGMSIDLIKQAPLLEGMFHPLDWGGANETIPLPNGDIGVLSHIAYFDHDDPGGERHYYASSFVFDPKGRRFKDFKIIASRDQFAAGPAKRPDLVNVVFSSGLVFADGQTTLYAGVSDVEAHWLEIDDPFADARGGA
ncbi:MAG: DUF1861 family protein [Pseudomonadota bacterium]